MPFLKVSGVPFDHFVFDGWFDDDTLCAAIDEFPAPDDQRWHTYFENHEAGKQEGSSPDAWGPHTQLVIAQLRSPQFIEALEEAFEVGPLLADYGGGGMHQNPPGARLDMHVDFNRHPAEPLLDRTLNAILFLTPDWTEEQGGTLVLQRHGYSQRIVPAFNRLVVFRCGEDHFHGHPEPVVSGVRRSIAMYYYQSGGEDRPNPHSTSWMEDAP